MVEIGVCKSEGLVAWVLRDKGFVLKQETNECVRGSSVVATNILIANLTSAISSLIHLAQYEKYDVSGGVKLEITSKALMSILAGGVVKEGYREEIKSLYDTLNKIPAPVKVVQVSTKDSIAKKYLKESCLVRSAEKKSKSDLAPTLQFTDIFG